MRIFNLAEELEKERKKNKELKKEIEKLTAESTEWEERTYCWQDRAEDLQIIIDKAIEYIETKSEKQYGFNFEYNLEETEIQDLLNILKGE